MSWRNPSIIERLSEESSFLEGKTLKELPDKYQKLLNKLNLIEDKINSLEINLHNYINLINNQINDLKKSSKKR